MSDDDPVRVTVAEASARLDQLAERASHGEVIHLVSGDREIARLVPPVSRVGAMRGTSRILGDVMTPTQDEWPSVLAKPEFGCLAL